MNKVELKKLLKPLIKECIKEVMFEDGVLSGVVSEVARGLGAPQILKAQRPQPKAEEKKSAQASRKAAREQKQKINESRQKLLDAIGNEAYNGVNLFEGTTPLSSGGPAPGAAPEPQGPLAGMAPNDPGVDITNLVGNLGRSWKAHMDVGK